MHRWNKNKKHIQPNFSGRMCFFVCYLGKESVPLLLQRFLNSNGHGNGSADHGVVAHAQEAHHFHVGRHGGGTGKLGVGMHTAHGVGHAVGSGAGRHVVGMQGTARAAAGGHGEVLLALLDALFLVGAGNGMLETKGAWLRMLRGGK